MKNIPIFGISKNYIPSSSLFNIDAYNCELELDTNIDSLTKVSCSCSGYLDDTFIAIDDIYGCVYINLDVRFDYICNQNEMRFHMYHSDKFMYVKLDKYFNKRDFNLDFEILDLDIINIDENKIYFYLLVISCFY